MQLPTDIASVFRLFIREEVNNWKVVREDETLEDFDPLTLLNSFVESEVPIDEAIDLFQRVVDRIGERIDPNGTLTYAQIHAIASEVFLEHPHPEHTLWFTNYENVF